MKKEILSYALPAFFALALAIGSTTAFADDFENNVWLYTQTSQSNQRMTADKGLQLLKEGNLRFVNGQSKNRDLLAQAKLTHAKGQYPFAVILSCMDSRGSPELIFDQGIGDIFSVRLAGNVLDADQLGSIEYATKAVGSHLIVVMGHTRCGAVAGSCSKVTLGNLTQLLQKIQPAVIQIKNANKLTQLNCQDKQMINAIAKQNVLNVVQEIKEKSKVVNELLASGKIKIIGAMHDLETGKVTFIES